MEVKPSAVSARGRRARGSAGGIVTCSKCKRDSPPNAMRHKTDARGNWTVVLCPSCNDDYLRVVDQDKGRDYIDRLKTFLENKT